MVNIELTEEAAIELRYALESYVSDLRMEIADTDRKAYRDNLHRREALLKDTLAQLGSPMGEARRV